MKGKSCGKVKRFRNDAGRITVKQNVSPRRVVIAVYGFAVETLHRTSRSAEPRVAAADISGERILKESVILSLSLYFVK